MESNMVKATRKQLEKANAITKKYSTWLEPHQVAQMYDELEGIGVTTGIITNRRENFAGSWSGRCGWMIDGVEVENSWFCYSVYEGANSTKNEYTIYFS